MKVSESNGVDGRFIETEFQDSDHQYIANIPLLEGVAKIITFSGQFGTYKTWTIKVPFFKGTLVTIKIDNLKWGQ